MHGPRLSFRGKIRHKSAKIRRNRAADRLEQLIITSDNILAGCFRGRGWGVEQVYPVEAGNCSKDSIVTTYPF